MADETKISEIADEEVVQNEAVAEAPAEEAKAAGEVLADETAEVADAGEAVPEAEAEEEAEPEIADAEEAKPEAKAEEKPAAPAAKPRRVSRSEQVSRNAARQIEQNKKDAIREDAIAKESILISAINRGAIVSGKIAAIEEIELDNKKDIAANIIIEGRNKVVIPFDELFPENPIDMSSVSLNTSEGRRDYLDRKKRFASVLIDADTIFVVKERFYDKASNITLYSGSRAEAMRRLRRQNFTGDRARYHEGDVVDAPIIANSVHSVTVEFGGVATTIQQFGLTLKYYTDLQVAPEFAVGQTIKVRIEKIAVGDNDVISLTLNHIFCELEDAKSRYDLLSDGSRVHAVITGIHRNGGTSKQGIRINAWIKSLELPANVQFFRSNAFGREIIKGTNVELQVNRHEENGFLGCAITRVFDSSGNYR